ncbi:hypothetical protein [Paraburkholderia sp. BCC1886]|uniref:hypothetical protein n=1 Tax=Paraburkholderia sp. BCC1886 TaxID=2562670 RepID=UPI001182BD23|nr:hypothetical protein [Paraburkholderia sp. BCC1886]
MISTHLLSWIGAALLINYMLGLAWIDRNAGLWEFLSKIEGTFSSKLFTMNILMFFWVFIDAFRVCRFFLRIRRRRAL